MCSRPVRWGKSSARVVGGGGGRGPGVRFVLLFFFFPNCRRYRRCRRPNQSVCTRSRHAAVVLVFVVVVVVRGRLCVRRRGRGARGRVAAVFPVGQPVRGRTAGHRQVRQNRIGRRRDGRGRARVRGLRGVPCAGPDPRLRGLGFRGPDRGPFRGRVAPLGGRRDRRRTLTGELFGPEHALCS